MAEFPNFLLLPTFSIVGRVSLLSHTSGLAPTMAHYGVMIACVLGSAVGLWAFPELGSPVSNPLSIPIRNQ